MEELIQNKNWSAGENQNLQSIIIKMNLNQNQKQILNEQIQRFQSSEKVRQLLLEYVNNWDKLQECLIKEISQTIENEKDWTHQKLLDLHQRLSQQIESEEQINQIIQFVQLNKINVKIVEKATKFEFKSADQFIQLVGSIFEQSTTKDSQQPITIKPNAEQDQKSYEQTIKDLFQEFNSINQRSNEQLSNLIYKVYSSLDDKVGFWLSDSDIVKIQNQYQTLQMIQETALKTKNNNQILNLATEVLGDQVRNGAISESTSRNLYDLINQCFQQSKGTVNGFQNSFCELAKKYLKLQIAKSTSNKSEKNQKKEVEEICSIQGNKKFNGIQNRIHEYQQYEKTLNNEIQQFSTIFKIIYSKDVELQKKIVTLDLNFEKFCNFDVEKYINSSTIQKYLNSTFNINDKDIQDECNNVKILDELSMNQFYQKVIRPKIMYTCNIFRDLCKFTEPIEIIFKEQYNAHWITHIERLKSQAEQILTNLKQLQQNQVTICQVEQIEQFKYVEQQCEQVKQLNNFESKVLVQNLKNQQMINNDGITVSNQFMNKFNNYLSQQNYCIMMIQVMEQAMKSTLQELENLRKNSAKKPFAKALIQAVEIEMIDEIKKYISKSRIKKQDKILTSQYE